MILVIVNGYHPLYRGGQPMQTCGGERSVRSRIGTPKREEHDSTISLRPLLYLCRQGDEEEPTEYAPEAHAVSPSLSNKALAPGSVSLPFPEIRCPWQFS